MRQIWTVLLIGSTLALAACAGRPHQTESTAPTVTYSFARDKDYDDVAQRADAYCGEQYSKDAVLVERKSDNGDFEATFACR